MGGDKYGQGQLFLDIQQKVFIIFVGFQISFNFSYIQDIFYGLVTSVAFLDRFFYVCFFKLVIVVFGRFLFVYYKIRTFYYGVGCGERGGDSAFVSVGGRGCFYGRGLFNKGSASSSEFRQSRQRVFLEFRRVFICFWKFSSLRVLSLMVVLVRRFSVRESGRFLSF